MEVKTVYITARSNAHVSNIFVAGLNARAAYTRPVYAQWRISVTAFRRSTRIDFSSYVQFALLDISRQLACMKLGSRGKHQPMQYCWVHTSQLLGYLVHTCHLPIDIQQLQYLQPIHVAEIDAPDHKYVTALQESEIAVGR